MILDSIPIALDTVAVGYIKDTHGLNGEVKVRVESDNPDRFKEGEKLLLFKNGKKKEELVISYTKSTSKFLVVKFIGIDNIERALQLKGGWLAVERDRVPPLEENQFYYFELVGSKCYNGNSFLGKVIGVIEGKGVDFIVVKNKDKEIPIPLNADYLLRVDKMEGKVYLDLPEGFVEICG